MRLDRVKYICKSTDNFTDEDKKEFLYLFNLVFNTDYGQDWFDWKYIDNIYGTSYIVLAYYNDKIVGIRSFWRNDIDGYLCYQPCDTVVSEDFRGYGIFSKMTEIALDKVDGAYVYNFPNENSLPGNLKLGWKVKKYSYLKLLTKKNSLREECKFIESDYLVWKFGKCPTKKYFYCEIDGQPYLLHKRKSSIYYILGAFEDKYKDLFINASHPILFNYTDKETIIYRIFKNRSILVSYQENELPTGEIHVPMFKADFF